MTTTCDITCDLATCQDCPAAKPETRPTRACIDHASIDPAECELLQELRDLLEACVKRLNWYACGESIMSANREKTLDLIERAKEALL